VDASRSLSARGRKRAASSEEPAEEEDEEVTAPAPEKSSREPPPKGDGEEDKSRRRGKAAKTTEAAFATSCKTKVLCFQPDGQLVLHSVGFEFPAKAFPGKMIRMWEKAPSGVWSCAVCTGRPTCYDPDPKEKQRFDSKMQHNQYADHTNRVIRACDWEGAGAKQVLEECQAKLKKSEDLAGAEPSEEQRWKIEKERGAVEMAAEGVKAWEESALTPVAWPVGMTYKDYRNMTPEEAKGVRPCPCSCSDRDGVASLTCFWGGSSRGGAPLDHGLEQ
jgi:hypothetical protein